MNCSYFEKCSAPLCPNNNNVGIWYPGDDICHHRSVLTSNLKQLRKNKFKDFYFTFDMLSKPMEELDDPRLKGIDAEPIDRKEAVKKWLIRNRLCMKPNKNEVF